MTFSPTGTLHLIGSVPIDNSYDNVIRFGSSDDQLAYFLGKKKYSLSQYTYMRADEIIKVSINYEDLFDVNYVAYLNKNKWIFAFVTHKEYVNESNTILSIETDVYQTYLFDAEILQSFVVREHVSDDSFGLHITEEGLDPGEYVRAACTVSGKLDTFKIVVAISYDKDLHTDLGDLYCGVYSGLTYLKFDVSSSGVTDLNALIKALGDAGKSSIIAAIFMMPNDFISADPYYPTDYDITPTSRTTTFQGYTPKNNKLYCYPYNLLFVSNNQGSGAVYRYEFMTSKDNPTFKIIGDMSPAPSVYLMPTGYKGVDTNADEKLVLNNFPLCSWNNDVYANWLAQNKNRLGAATITNAAMAIGGGYAGDPAMAASGMMGIVGELTQVMDRSIQPAQAMGNLGGSGALSVGLQDFFFYPTTITAEYAARIDKFFDLYGYKIDTVKVPNTSGRPYWNYVLTKGINLKGSLPMEHMRKLRSVYDHGVTIWHSGDNIGNYSLNNH